jgi:hypothetical protein
MDPNTTFADVVEAADKLSLDEQQTLLEILRRRLAEQERLRLIRDVQEARDEFAEGRCRIASPQEIMHELQS